jgi:hypothetical protein
MSAHAQKNPLHPAWPAIVLEKAGQKNPELSGIIMEINGLRKLSRPVLAEPAAFAPASYFKEHARERLTSLHYHVLMGLQVKNFGILLRPGPPSKLL